MKNQLRWLCLLLLAGCGIQDGLVGVEDDELVVSIDGGHVQPGTLLSVMVSGADGVSGAGSLTIAGTPIPLQKANDSVYIGLTPELPSGDQTLHFKLAGMSAEQSIDVRPGIVIADPAASTRASLEGLSEIVATDGGSELSPSEWAGMREMIQGLMSQLEAALAQASPEEQLATARILQSVGEPIVPAMSVAARPSIAGPGTATMAMVAAVAESCSGKLKQSAAMLLIFLAALAALLFGSQSSATGIGLGPGLALSVLGAMALYKVVAPAALSVAELAITCSSPDGVDWSTDPFGDSSELRADMKAAVAQLTFVPDLRTTIYPKLRIRPLSGKDAAEPEFAEVEGYLQRIHSLASFLPNAIRSKLTLPAPLSTLPERPAQLVRLDADQVKIDNVSPSSVILVAADSGAALHLTATTGTGLTEDLPFTFDIVSVHDTEVRKSVSAVLVGNDSVAIYRAAIAGRWTKEFARDPSLPPLEGTCPQVHTFDLYSNGTGKLLTYQDCLFNVDGELVTRVSEVSEGCSTVEWSVSRDASTFPHRYRLIAEVVSPTCTSFFEVDGHLTNFPSFEIRQETRGYVVRTAKN